MCLTTALLRYGAPPPHLLYKQLRSLNPAPYAAWLHFGNAGASLCVLLLWLPSSWLLPSPV